MVNTSMVWLSEQIFNDIINQLNVCLFQVILLGCQNELILCFVANVHPGLAEPFHKRGHFRVSNDKSNWNQNHHGEHVRHVAHEINKELQISPGEEFDKVAKTGADSSKSPNDPSKDHAGCGHCLGVVGRGVDHVQVVPDVAVGGRVNVGQDESVHGMDVVQANINIAVQ